MYIYNQALDWSESDEDIWPHGVEQRKKMRVLDVHVITMGIGTF